VSAWKKACRQGQQCERQRHRTAQDLGVPQRARRPGHTEGPYGLGRLAAWPSLSLNPQVAKRVPRVRELQIKSLLCKPICKPDATRQPETGETEPTERDGICPVHRGHRTRKRQPETGKTQVVWLISQRSRVQIPPPLPRPEADPEQGIGLFPVVLHDRVTSDRLPLADTYDLLTHWLAFDDPPELVILLTMTVLLPAPSDGRQVLRASRRLQGHLPNR
jgi:hypothetical protein